MKSTADFTNTILEGRERTRTLDIEGYKVHIICTDPFSHWHVEGIDGMEHLPPHMDGAYTNITALEHGIRGELKKIIARKEEKQLELPLPKPVKPKK